VLLILHLVVGATLISGWEPLGGRHLHQRPGGEQQQQQLVAGGVSSAARCLAGRMQKSTVTVCDFASIAWRVTAAELRVYAVGTRLLVQAAASPGRVLHTSGAPGC
jgi:hypothetical protein